MPHCRGPSRKLINILFPYSYEPGPQGHLLLLNPDLLQFKINCFQKVKGPGPRARPPPKRLGQGPDVGPRTHVFFFGPRARGPGPKCFLKKYVCVYIAICIYFEKYVCIMMMILKMSPNFAKCCQNFTKFVKKKHLHDENSA